jgi:hypothetical protein
LARTVVLAAVEGSVSHVLFISCCELSRTAVPKHIGWAIRQRGRVDQSVRRRVSLCGSFWTDLKKCQPRPNPAPTRTVTTKAKANPSTMPTSTLRSGKPSPMSSWKRSSCACLSSPSRASVPSAARGTTPSST